MKPSINSIQTQLNRDEDRRTLPYLDTVGKTTIGVGRNLTDKGLSPKEIDFLLQNDVDDTDRALSHYDWMAQFRIDEPVRYGVLQNMCFNLGPIRFGKFINFLAFVEKRDWNSASIEMLNSAWAKQVGDRAIRLSKQMKIGVWQ